MLTIFRWTSEIFPVYFELLWKANPQICYCELIKIAGIFIVMAKGIFDMNSSVLIIYYNGLNLDSIKTFTKICITVSYVFKNERFFSLYKTSLWIGCG